MQIKELPPVSQFTDSRGVSYAGFRLSWRDEGSKGRGNGITIRRTSPRPVDIKRAERAAKREAKS